MRIIIIASLILLLLIAGCSKATEDKAIEKTLPEKEKNEMLKGVSLSPKSFQPNDFNEFFNKAAEAGSIITWSGDWSELSNEKGGPFVVTELSKQKDYMPIIITQFFTQSSGKLLRPLDVSYKKSAVDFAAKYKPKYFGMGIEINMLNEKSPQDFEDFVKFYNYAYDEIKAISPETKVFTVFQLEKMKGLNGGLFGGMNDESNAQWKLLEKFKTDIIVFTTYPGLIYKNPSEIPADYYTKIKKHTDKPIAFSEAGWHSANSPTGWESSEEEQAEFVKIFLTEAKKLEPEFVVWSFLYDQNTMEPFDTMGLFSKESNKKQGMDAWINI